jgi:hypothetical protein
MQVFLPSREVIITLCSVPFCELFPGKLFLVIGEGMVDLSEGVDCFGMHAKALLGMEMSRLDMGGGGVFEVVGNTRGRQRILVEKGRSW